MHFWRPEMEHLIPCQYSLLAECNSLPVTCDLWPVRPATYDLHLPPIQICSLHLANQLSILRALWLENRLSDDPRQVPEIIIIVTVTLWSWFYFLTWAWLRTKFSSPGSLLYFIDRQNGSLVLRLGGLWWMCWPNEPNWNIFGWNCFGFSFKPPGLILVGPSANSINSRPPSPVMILKSCSLISWCSCLPWTPNYWVRSHRIIWIKGSVLLPPSFSLLASREFLFFPSDSCRALFRRLPRPAKRSCFTFVCSTCLAEINSLDRL